MSQIGLKKVAPWLTTAAVVAVTVVALRYEGRLWWCECGQLRWWIGSPQSSHTSQHLLDPFSFTHVLHGVIFFWVLAWLLPRLSLAWRFAIATAVEAAWEIFENTSFVIGRYRERTAALGYYGDTVVNSLGDVATCCLGFWLARMLGFRWSLVLFAVIEIGLLITIRDSLLLSGLMLIFPIEAIKAWQMGA